VLVATASLELGIDIGDVDLVCQIARRLDRRLPATGRPLRAPGRRHAQGAPVRHHPRRPDRMRRPARLRAPGELDPAHPVAPLDVLAQQIIAEVSCQEWDERAARPVPPGQPYAALDEGHYQALLRMLAEGYNGRQGMRSAYLHRDAVSASLRGRRGAS
jgi:ATP-dependent Lhr-like helicase